MDERAYTILRIMSIQGYKMWTNDLSTQERVYNQMTFECKKIKYNNITITNCF